MCDHVIGLLRHRDYQELSTVDRLIDHIRYREEWNDMIKRDPNYADLQHFMIPGYTMSDYGDLRKSTNLVRFKYCPLCGSAIDWKSLKHTTT